MKKMPVKIFNSFEEAQRDYEKGVFDMIPEARVSAMEVLRRRIYKIKGIKENNTVDRKHIEIVNHP